MHTEIRRLFFLVCTVASAGCSTEPANDWLPPKNFKAEANTGKMLYDVHCLSCHGSGANGSESGPALTNKIYNPTHHADLAFYMAVSSGVVAHHWHYGNMPAIPQLTNKDVAHIVAYVRAEQKKAGVY